MDKLIVSTDMYEDYVNDLAMQTFDTNDVDWFVDNRTRGHRSERILGLLLLRNKETFEKYQEVLPDVYKVVLGALFETERKSPFCHKICEEFVGKYGVDKPKLVETSEKSQQLVKGLDTYVAYRLRANMEDKSNA